MIKVQQFSWKKRRVIKTKVKKTERCDGRESHPGGGRVVHIINLLQQNMHCCASNIIIYVLTIALDVLRKLPISEDRQCLIEVTRLGLLLY